MRIGEKIAEVRRLNKLTQRDLAEKLNVSDKVISKWETGKSLPDVETMLKLSKILGISISELYECVEETDTEKKRNIAKKECGNIRNTASCHTFWLFFPLLYSF